MRVPLAWRILAHSWLRTVLAVTGLCVALMMVFLQLGLFESVARGGTVVTDRLNFDVLLVSKNYIFIREPGSFPRHRLYQAESVDGVVSANAVYTMFQIWRNEERGKSLTIFVLAADPDDHVFLDRDVNAHTEQLKHPDTFLLDRATRPAYGQQQIGRDVEIGRRKMKLIGTYSIGIGYVDLGAMIVSDQNARRLMPGRSLERVNLGLIKLEPAADPIRVVHKLRQHLPIDVQLLTRAEYEGLERDFWTMSTPTGMIFASGTIVAVVVGSVILYQTLSAQIISYLPQFATLKALGYSNANLSWVVLKQAVGLAVAGFLTGSASALGLYRVIEQRVHVTVEMTSLRLGMVLGLALLMAFATGFLSLRPIYRSDPADLF